MTHHVAGGVPVAEVMCSTYIVLARLGGKYSFRIEEGGGGN